ncbi:SMP-30/gluconolactonase/LRE family protein [Streptomyces malaysiensis subsp. malaysiensis]|uniref:SMP-30/gluconolactonase/LRE family protein n=1 Tax=Streptomyces malaysiensis TaxID=92644 RepID=UPI000BFBB664|nr:SMP-30/gluconolactonase/LRE family protein [Streptomyces malaysiensis]ATL82643.1 calcium-binding protein [Streptomyces malaysiensis]QDL73092.1 SMP-30/gluconolactonase/LRE family protein [Streptomyces malaysiensis]
MSTRPSLEIAVRASAVLGEGPTWDAAAGRLIWVDILSSRVHGYDPATGRRTTLATEQHVGAAKPRAGGGLVVNLRDGIGVYGADGGFDWLLREPVPGRRGNDAAVAPDGSLWAGTMRYEEAAGGGTLSRVGSDGSPTEILPEVTVSNGIGWSPDGRLMYYIDTPTRRIDVFDVDPDMGAAAGADGPAVSGRRPFAEVEEGAGFPDGLCVDADGAVWVALWDGAAIRRYAPDGTLDRVVELPFPRPTACAFGGADLTDLYLTSARVGLGASAPPLAGSLLVIEGAGQGLAQPAFAG